jgi:hypothetical protein
LELLFKTELKGKLKTDIAHEWVNNAIPPRRILFTFCQLPIVKRSLPLYFPIPIKRPLPSQVQKTILDIQGSRKKINPIDDPKWTPYEMDKESFSKLVSTFKKKYPGLYAYFERLRKQSIEEAERGSREV